MSSTLQPPVVIISTVSFGPRASSCKVEEIVGEVICRLRAYRHRWQCWRCGRMQRGSTSSTASPFGAVQETYLAVNTGIFPSHIVDDAAADERMHRRILQVVQRAEDPRAHCDGWKRRAGQRRRRPATCALAGQKSQQLQKLIENNRCLQDNRERFRGSGRRRPSSGVAPRQLCARHTPPCGERLRISPPPPSLSPPSNDDYSDVQLAAAKHQVSSCQSATGTVSEPDAVLFSRVSVCESFASLGSREVRCRVRVRMDNHRNSSPQTPPPPLTSAGQTRRYRRQRPFQRCGGGPCARACAARGRRQLRLVARRRSRARSGRST